MDLIVAVGSALVFPWVCLGFVVWMGRMEDAMGEEVRLGARQPDPPPILSIAVRVPALPPARLPAQRSEVSRSALTSLGGSTNR